LPENTAAAALTPLAFNLLNIPRAIVELDEDVASKMATRDFSHAAIDATTPAVSSLPISLAIPVSDPLITAAIDLLTDF